MSEGMAGAKSILKNVFGYDDFWPLQEAIIAHLLEKKNALVVLPTGGGKSLCYQIPALIYEGLIDRHLSPDLVDEKPGGRAAGMRRCGRISEQYLETR